MSHSGFDFDTAQAAAMRRLTSSINRAAGQHKRAMARQWAQAARVQAHQPTAHGNTPGEMGWLNADDAAHIKTHQSPEFDGPSLLTMVRWALAFWLVVFILVWVY